MAQLIGVPLWALLFVAAMNLGSLFVIYFGLDVMREGLGILRDRVEAKETPDAR